MLSWLRGLAQRVKWSSIVPGSNDASRDPYSYVRQPLVHKPGGRNGAIALEEPDGDQNLQLIGRRLGR